MATEARSEVVVGVRVDAARAPSEIGKVTESLKDLKQAQQEVNQTAGQLAKDVPRSMADVAAQAAAKNLWNLPVRDPAKTIVEDVKPAVQQMTSETRGMLQTLASEIQDITRNIKRWFSGAFESIVPMIKNVGGKIATALTGWGAFGIGFGVSAIFDNAIKGMGELVDTVDKLAPVASNIDSSIQELQRFTMWAKQSGVPVNTVTRSLQDLTKTIGNINEGLGGPGIKAKLEAFGELGFLDEAGKVRFKNVYELIPELMQKLAEMDEPAKRAAYASTILGQSWRQMLPLLMQGPEAFQAAVEASKRAGEITPNMQKAAEDWKKTSEEFYASLRSMREQLGGVLIESLAPVLQELVTLVQDNRDVLVSGFKLMGEAVKFFASGLVETLRVIKEIREGDYLTALQRLFSGPESVDTQKWTSWQDALKAGLSYTFEVEGFKNLGAKASEAFAEGFRGVLEKIKEVLKSIPEINLIITGIDKLTGWLGQKGATAPTPAIGPTVVSTGGGPIKLEDLLGARNGGPILGQPANGEVKVTIENKNPPAGTTTKATATGPGVR